MTVLDRREIVGTVMPPSQPPDDDGPDGDEPPYVDPAPPIPDDES